MVAEAVAMAVFCSMLCKASPRIAARVMERRRKAHRAWFDAGATEYAASPDPNGEWVRSLPRLIDDRAIGREDAETAAALGVPNLPDASELPTRADIDARFALSNQSASRLGTLLAVAGAAYGAALPLLGADLAQAAILGAIASACALMAIVDQRCRIITNGTIGTLCALGICLRIACGQQSEIAPTCAAAIVLCLFMYTADAVYARLHSGHRAFGNADKKIMVAIELCSGASGTAVAVATLIALLAATVILCKDRAAKRAFGPYAAAAILTGAIASATM